MTTTSGYSFWRYTLKSARFIVAPMVDQSELAWRMLSRKYGAQLCYTPMLHASVFTRDQNYRRDNLVTCAEDRPLIVQFCANDPQTLLEAARHAEPYCDAVDINLGCPQAIARKGHYGAFLQDEWDLIGRMVNLLHTSLTVPVTCKIRVFEDVEKTVQYARMLESAGCQLLTVHGRTRDQKGPNTGVASWEHIRAVKQNVRIPVFANGNIQFAGDVERCMRETGVDGVMTAEGSLFNPAIFTEEQPLCWRMVEEYIESVRQYPCSLTYIRGHLFKLWFHVLKQPEYLCYREKLGIAKSLQEVEALSAELKARLLASIPAGELDKEFSLDGIPYWRCQPYVRPGPVTQAQEGACSVPRSPESSDIALAIRRLRRKRKGRNTAALTPKAQRWVTCDMCQANPRGVRCDHGLCKPCCKVKCKRDRFSCTGHRFFANPQERETLVHKTAPVQSSLPASEEGSGHEENCTSGLSQCHVATSMHSSSDHAHQAPVELDSLREHRPSDADHMACQTSVQRTL